MLYVGEGFQNTAASYHKKNILLVLLLFVGAIAAALPLLPIAHAAASTSKLTIGTETTEGGFIFGFYTVLNQSNTIIATGLTETSFTLNNGQTYTAQVDDYGNCKFDHWFDTGSTTRARTVSITTDTSYVAVMSCGSILTVVSGNTNSQEIFGYHMILWQNGNVVANGFTPTTFAALTEGQMYSIQANDYGSCTFAYWAGGTTSNPMTFTASSSPMSLDAVYQCGGTSSTATVQSVDQNGNAITGYYDILTDENGKQVGNGFTPTTYSPLTTGQNYTLLVENYGSCAFDHWNDGNANNPRTFLANGARVFTAVYHCGATTTSTVNVSTVNSMGTQISGYYITLWQNGVQLQSCFSACSFTVNNGQTYQVMAASYSSETFNHWTNDGSTGFETVNVPSTSTTISLTAIYSP